jgi:hypothetical protein
MRAQKKERKMNVERESWTSIIISSCPWSRYMGIPSKFEINANDPYLSSKLQKKKGDKSSSRPLLARVVWIPSVDRESLVTLVVEAIHGSRVAVATAKARVIIVIPKFAA